MQIELLKPFGILTAGTRVDTTPGFAEHLIRRGIARESKPEKRGGKNDNHKAFFSPPKK